MTKTIATMLALAVPAVFMLHACYASGDSAEIEIIATTRVHVSTDDVADFRKVVADFAVAHRFSRGEQSTMPRNRKIFLMAGAFSTTFRSKDDDYYLLVHNIVGKDCILVDLYASGDRPFYQHLMTDLEQTIKTALPGKATIVNNGACSD